MNFKLARRVLGPLIILATIAVFLHYMSQHPAIWRQVRTTPPLVLAGLVLLYIGWFAALGLVMHLSLRIYRRPIKVQENILLNAYSTLVNFFGPGQSGPAVRGAYLRAKHHLRIKDYLFTMLLYYAFYVVVSAFFLFAGSQAWWRTLLVVALASLACWWALRRFARRKHLEADKPQLTLANLGWLFFATAAQAVLQMIIYFIEIHQVQAHVTLAQSITYTGAANFALFVALTPGAIGIRESFLLLTRRLHHISSSTIVAANVIDRAAFIIFLGVLFVLVLSMHAKDKLHLKSSAEAANE